MKGIQFIPDDVNINFIGMRYLAFIVSAVLVVGSLVLVAQKGLNFGIDFTGGTVIEVRTPEVPDLADLRTKLNDLGLGAVSIQEFGEPDDLLIRLPQQVETEDEAAERQACLEANAKLPQKCPTKQQLAIEKVRGSLDATFEGQEVDYRRTEFVGPQVGEELKQQGFIAVLLSLLGIMAYIWFRFEWQFGITALAALAHDVTATVGFFALTQMEFNLSTVAAILMIAGYSINDTVIVFDRIRENLRKYKKTEIKTVLNQAVNQTLSRTLVTSGTTLLALLALYIFGGEVIRGFVDALIFGIFVGTYSSVFVASQLLLYFNVRKSVQGVSTDTDAEEQTA